MRISATAAAAASAVLGGALVLGLTAVPAAQAAPAADAAACTTDAFGIAGKYGEFVLGDDVHTPDAEGAVAVGGNADFRGGFSAANELTAAEVDALPGRASLVVRGDLLNGSSVTAVMKGNAVVGGKVSDRALEMHSGTFSKNAGLIDFDAEFGKLRSYSAALAKEPATGGTEVKPSGSKLTLEGGNTTRNIFEVTAEQLEGAKDIYLKVPAERHRDRQRQRHDVRHGQGRHHRLLPLRRPGLRTGRQAPERLRRQGPRPPAVELPRRHRGHQEQPGRLARQRAGPQGPPGAGHRRPRQRLGVGRLAAWLGRRGDAPLPVHRLPPGDRRDPAPGHPDTGQHPWHHAARDRHALHPGEHPAA